MPVITKTFDYSGQLFTSEIPAGTTTLTLHLWGGGGGSGGSDSAGEGADGAAGRPHCDRAARRAVVRTPGTH